MISGLLFYSAAQNLATHFSEDDSTQFIEMRSKFTPACLKSARGFGFDAGNAGRLSGRYILH